MLPYRTLNCNGKLVSLQHPAVMGIVNVNSDSFYAGSRSVLEKEVLSRLEAMVEQGGAMLDLGAMSSRPGSTIIDPEEEWTRLSAVLPAVRKSFPDLILSIDTVHSQTAHKSLDLGVDIINDISGGTYDPEMFAVVGQYDAPFVLMHMQGRPENMQVNRYPMSRAATRFGNKRTWRHR